MRRAVLAGLILAACSGKKESAPAPSASEGSAPASAGSAQVEAAADAAAAPVSGADRYRTLVVPEVDASLRLDPAADGPIVVAAILQVSFDGAPVVRVMGGKVDPKAVDGKGVITALSELYGAYAKATSPEPTQVNVAVVPQLRAGVLLDVMSSLAAGGQPSVGLLVRNPAGTGSMPLFRRADDLRLLSRVGIILTADEVMVGAARFPLTAPDVWTLVRKTLRDMGGAEPVPLVWVADDARVQDLAATVGAVLYDDSGARVYPNVSLSRRTPTPPRDGDDGAAIEEEAARYANALAVMSSDDDSSGSSGDMSKRAPGGDLSAQLDEVRKSGAQVSIGGGTRGDDARAATGAGTSTSTSTSTSTGTGTGTGTGTTTTTSTRDGRIQVVDKKSFDETSLTPDMVVRKITSAYLAGLKRCYKQGLKTDPTLRGKLAIDLTVNEMGRVSNHNARGFDADVEACVDGQLGNWRFNVPKDVDGEATEASFKLTLMMSTE